MTKQSMPKQMSQKELQRFRKGGYLTVGKLKEFLAETNLPDTALVLVQRVEDKYYEKHGWDVYLKEGYHFHSHVEMNKNMQDEIERRARGEEPEYPKIDDPSKYICSEEDVVHLKEQYHPAWCCVHYSDDEELFIDLHY